MSKLSIPVFAGFLTIFYSSTALAVDIPPTDQGLFKHLFKEYSIPKDWISEPARGQLHPKIIADATTRLLINGGKYQRAEKSGSFWLLEFEKGTAKVRIIRSQDHKLVGVYFGKIE